MITCSNISNIPSYYNDEFLNKMMKKVINMNNFIIDEVHIAIEGNNGDHFCSDLHCLKIIFSTDSMKRDTMSLILKGLEKANASTFLKTLNVCEKERLMYVKVIPAINALLNDNIGPKCFYYGTEPIIHLVLEDLTLLGYELKNREIGLDVEHSKLVMSQIGKFHAASMVYIKQHPDVLPIFQYGFFNPVHLQRPNSYIIIEENLSYVIKMIKNWFGYESIAEKLKQLEKTFTKRIFALLNTHCGRVQAINHGDLWINNILFKYNQDNSLKDLKLIDYQMCVRTSIALDINHFLHSSVQYDVLVMNREQLIRTYFDNLQHSLKELNYHNLPTFDDVLEEIHNLEFYSLFVVIGILPVVGIKRNHDKNTSIEALKAAGDDIRHVMFSSERVLDILKYTLKRIDTLGALDKLINVELK